MPAYQAKPITPMAAPPRPPSSSVPRAFRPATGPAAAGVPSVLREEDLGDVVDGREQHERRDHGDHQPEQPVAVQDEEPLAGLAPPRLAGRGAGGSPPDPEGSRRDGHDQE